MVIARDVTARRELASHLAEAERLDSIGKLAGHIAHDFNNLLTAIIGNAEIALRQMEPNDRAAADVEKIMDVSRRASSLTRQLLSFARRQSTTARVIDVKAYIEEAMPLLRRVVGDQVTLETVLDPSTPHVRFDSTQLEQVLVNLAANARDAMPSGGTLTITTAHSVVGEARRRGRRPCSWPLPGTHGDRHGHRDVGRGSPAHLRAVLQHQARQGRHRPRDWRLPTVR